jgi:hypothetical protein
MASLCAGTCKNGLDGPAWQTTVARSVCTCTWLLHLEQARRQRRMIPRRGFLWKDCAPSCSLVYYHGPRQSRTRPSAAANRTRAQPTAGLGTSTCKPSMPLISQHPLEKEKTPHSFCVVHCASEFPLPHGTRKTPSGMHGVHVRHTASPSFDGARASVHASSAAVTRRASTLRPSARHAHPARGFAAPAT